MATFHKGQRVRIKWSEGWPELAGEVGTIIEPSAYPDSHPTPGAWCWIVAPDCWGKAEAPTPSVINGYMAFVFGPREDQLEPATDANEKVEWENCLWIPEHLRETV